MPNRPKHVVWITTDHMRHDCVGAYGLAPVHTPNLDALAGGGVNLAHCFTQNHCCMPSRASFFTGLYPQQTGVTDNGHCLPPEFFPTAPRVFGGLGYDTGHVGKLHLQPHTGVEWQAAAQHDYGFGEFYCSESIWKPGDPYHRYLLARYPECVGEFHPSEQQKAQRETPARRVAEGPWQASHSGFVAEVGSELLGLRGWNSQFLHLGLFAPHPPLIPSAEAFEPYADADIELPEVVEDEWADKPPRLAKLIRSARKWGDGNLREYRRYFYAMVTELDLAVGRIVETLRKRGELDETLLVFTSDHGDQLGEHGMTLKAPHFYDGVMHVPVILHWPNGLGRERRDVRGMVEMVDLLPTMVELAGGVVPGEMAGRSIAGDLLAGREPAGREDVFAFASPDWCMLRSPEWKYLRYADDQEVLYDLAADPAEVKNVAADRPELLAHCRRRLLDRALVASRSPQRKPVCW